MEFRIRHDSEQEEARTKRKVQAEIPALAFETQARLIAQAKLDSALALKGFLATKSRRSKRLILHVTNIEFIEGA